MDTNCMSGNTDNCLYNIIKLSFWYLLEIMMYLAVIEQQRTIPSLPTLQDQSIKKMIFIY